MLAAAVAARPPPRHNAAMPDPDTTRWSVVLGAARGEAAAREEFARRYEPIARAYLGARWRHSPLAREIDDAAQEVFLACFRDDGALQRVDPDRPAGFRPFLFGVVRNVARQAEERWSRRRRKTSDATDLGEIESDEETLSAVFDRAWAISVLRQALERQEARAREKGETALRRLELLRLRFEEGLPIREIAKAWDVRPNTLHTEYLRARQEFEEALRGVLRDLRHGEADLDAELARLAGHLR
jgi:RNA polymerase sigma factor (sigma-70 family)